MRIVLYEPDIPQNFGSILRIAACFGAEVHLIEPCGFPVDDARIRRAGMDYASYVIWKRHLSWTHFLQARGSGRLVLMTTKGATPLQEALLNEDDWIIFGRESAGVPEEVHADADLRIVIPMKEGMRSLNIAVSAGIVLWEMSRQHQPLLKGTK